jgi:hypothetical protein
VAGACGCLDAEGATGLLGDGDLRHAVTLASRQSKRCWPGPSLYAAAPGAPCRSLADALRGGFDLSRAVHGALSSLAPLPLDPGPSIAVQPRC